MPPPLLPPTIAGDKQRVHASDALPLQPPHQLPLVLHVSCIPLLPHAPMARKDPTFHPSYVFDLTEIISLVSLIYLLFYLLSFFGVAFVQTIIDDDTNFPTKSSSTIATPPPLPLVFPLLVDNGTKYVKKIISVSSSISVDDEEIVFSVVPGKTLYYSLESRLGDCLRAVGVRLHALKRITSRRWRGSCWTASTTRRSSDSGTRYPSGTCRSLSALRGPSCSTEGPTAFPWTPWRGDSSRAPTVITRPLRSREGW